MTVHVRAKRDKPTKSLPGMCFWHLEQFGANAQTDAASYERCSRMELAVPCGVCSVRRHWARIIIGKIYRPADAPATCRAACPTSSGRHTNVSPTLMLGQALKDVLECTGIYYCFALTIRTPLRAFVGLITERTLCGLKDSCAAHCVQPPCSPQFAALRVNAGIVLVGSHRHQSHQYSRSGQRTYPMRMNLGR
jgi:hypothetical protein